MDVREAVNPGGKIKYTEFEVFLLYKKENWKTFFLQSQKPRFQNVKAK